MTTKALHARVTGRVQGVGFRYATARAGRELGVIGWVRNDADGSVELWVQGEADAVDQMVRFVRVGPRGATVDSAVVTPGVMNESLTGFDVRF